MRPRHSPLQFLAAVFLIVSTLVRAEAVTYSVASVYVDSYATEMPAYSSYAIGISVPAQAGGTLTYSAVVTGVASNNGFSAYSYFSRSASTMAQIGPAGTTLMYSIYGDNGMDGTTFVVFGPLSQSVDNSGTTVFLNYMQQVYWTTASEQAQAVALLAVLARRDLFPFSQMMFRISSIGIGYSASLFYSKLASVYGVTIASVSGQRSYSASDYTNAIAAKPGIVYQYGMTEGEAITSTWNTNLVADSTLIQVNATIATTFEMHYDILMVYLAKLVAGTPLLPAENFVTAAPVPGVDATEYTASVDFVKQAGSSFPAGMSQSLKNFMMAGWVSGTALMQALNMYTGSSVGSSTPFFKTLLAAQSSFVVSDLFIGTYAPRLSTCTTAESTQGILCGCHHGGNNIWFHTFVKNGVTVDTAAIHGELYQYALGNCANLIPPGDEIAAITSYQQLIQTPLAIHVAGFAPTDNAMIASICSQTHDVITRLSNVDLYQHVSAHAYRGYCVPSTVSTMTTALSTHSSTYAMTSMMGVMPDGVTAPTTLVLDYMPQTTQPHVSKANLVYLFPTLEQELYVLASYLGSTVTDASVVCATVTSSSVSAAIVTLLTTTLATFGMSLTADHTVQGTAGLGSSIPATCTHTFVIGMGDDDAAGLLTYLQTHPNAYVLASFDDITKYYSSLAPALGSSDAAVTNRFVFATNAPLWTGTASNPTTAAASAPLTTVEQFLQSVPVELQTPAAVRAYMTAMLYDQLSAGGYPGTGNMQGMLYGNVSWTVGGLELGPFSQQCMDVTAAATTCLYNYGARDISVWSYTRVVTPSTAVLQQAATPSLAYVTNSPNALLPVGAGGAVDNCVEVSESSNPTDVTPATTTTTTTTTTTAHPAVGASSAKEGEGDSTPAVASKHSDSSDDAALETLMIVLGACLGVAVLVVVFLLLVKFGLLRWCATLVPGCCMRHRGSDASSVLRARERHQEGNLALQCAAQDVSRAPPLETTQPLTFVCVDVAQYRALWVSAPEVMSRIVDDYHRCVRQSIVRHGCYEVDSVDGLFIIACSSADAGVSVALDCAAACCINTLDGESLSETYAALGCGSGTPGCGGLRLRIAVHCGTACLRDDTSTSQSRIRWGGAAVDDVVCTAYCSRVAWQVTVTDDARRAMKIVDAEDVIVVPLGSSTLCHSGATELFAVRQQSPGERAEVPLGTGSYEHVLRVLEAGVDRPDAAASALCERHFSAFLSSCCRGHDVAYVTAVAQCLGLPAVSRDDYADDAAHAAALRRAVCGRLGALLECSHGVWSEDVSRTPSAQGGSWGTPVEGCLEGWSTTDVVASVNSRWMGSVRKSRYGLRSKRVGLCHFSYAKTD